MVLPSCEGALIVMQRYVLVFEFLIDEESESNSSFITVEIGRKVYSGMQRHPMRPLTGPQRTCNIQVRIEFLY